MPTKNFSASVLGIDALIIEIETDFSNGLHSFQIVGLADKAIEESKERISLALKNSGLKPPISFHKKLVVNLAPADVKKEGSGFDLGIAIGFLNASQQISNLNQSKNLFVGELAFDGSIRKTPGILPIVEMAAKNGFEKIFIPQANAQEASLLAEKINIFAFSNLKDLIIFLENPLTSKAISGTNFKVEKEMDFEIDEIAGLEPQKRALTIAAAGAHNLLFKGPPGTGKSLLAKALSGILPDLTKNEQIEVNKIYSVADLLNSHRPLITERPFRGPHHTASVASIIGGGQNPKPGEISLAHRGVLFLDEIPEFNRLVLESLRQPLEEGEITVSRIKGSLKFPARFILIAAMNPCPCGWFGDPQHDCVCSQQNILKYQKKISGPLLDRIDLVIEVPRTSYQDLKNKTSKGQGEKIKSSVSRARQIQLRRFQGQNLISNAEMKPKQIKEFCQLDLESEQLLEKAEKQFVLSPRALHRIIKVSRTIADLSGSENIKIEHLAEALQYRD